jgi:hypothetical protein
VPLNGGAFEARLAQLRRLDEAELHVINLPITDVVFASFSAATKIQQLLPRLQRLEALDLSLVSALEEWAYILQQANEWIRFDTPPTPVSRALIDEGLQLRRSLKAEAAHLASRGVVKDARLGKVTSSKGYAKLASDLLLLTRVLQDTRTAWTGKSALLEGELRQAHAVGVAIAHALHVREQHRPSEWRDLRLRAFTMVRRAHAEARAAVLYLLRDEEGADGVIPPLAHRRYRTAKRRPTRDQRQGPRHARTQPDASDSARSKQK